MPAPLTRNSCIHPPSSLPSHTFESENTVAQGVHDVIECGFIGHIEEVFVIRVAGDVLDLIDERLRILLPADVMTQNLQPNVTEREVRETQESR